MKKIISIGVIVIGAVMLFFSNYIADQVAAGNQEADQGQRKLNNFSRIFSATPVTKEVGKEITKPYQQRIDTGRLTIAEYEALVKKLQIAGVIFIVVGVSMLIFWKD